MEVTQTLTHTDMAMDLMMVVFVVSQKEQLAGARWLFPDGPLTNQKEDVNNLFMEVVKEIETILRQRQHVIKNVDAHALLLAGQYVERMGEKNNLLAVFPSMA